MDILTDLVLVIGELRLDLEGVGTEVITLSLEKVGREVLGAVSIEPRESSGESRGWDTEESSLGDNISPAWLSLVDSLVEEVVEEKVLEVVIGVVGGGDVLEEDGSNDTSSAPHESDGWLVKLPLVFAGSLEFVSTVKIAGEGGYTSCINMKPWE